LSYETGIQTFDTANVRQTQSQLVTLSRALNFLILMYANRLSEIVLGKAIKKLQFPREEIVVMTKVSLLVTRRHSGDASAQVRHPVGKTFDVKPLDLYLAGPDTLGYVN
jgi:aryl-alcohol dehydrogenase-like predicted oxidoreductase